MVFGDIGTSPLYAFREALGQAGGVTLDSALGVASLALWALILTVTVKYVLFLMRADNRGEGGVLSLMALAQQAAGKTRVIFILGLVGAALFYGDAVITPAISVLSAVEGLRTIPSLEHVVDPTVVLVVSLAILVGLFAAQSRGTAGVARWFGPICVVWFVSIAALGIMHLVKAPGALAALSPLHGLSFLGHHGVAGMFVLGSVFLTVTGAEALYADMGHFGRWPIQASWLCFVLPALALNYLGQCAFALTSLAQAHATTIPNKDWFFLMTPEAVRAPLIVLATAATVIASQAVITGAFSLTAQAMQLGLLPRMAVTQTSATESGQIYIPRINLLLAAGVVLLVAIFKSSTSLAHAYGLAVTGTMAVTTSLAFFIVRRKWKWPLAGTLALIVPLLALDLVFLAANGLKLLSGGFVPLMLGAALFTIMAVWVRGSGVMARKVASDGVSVDDAVAMLKARAPHLVAGTAIYLTGDPDVAPGALMHNLKHNRVLHERNILLTVRTAATPTVDAEKRLKIEPLDERFTRVTLTFGFMERPNVPKALAACRRQGLAFDIMTTSFFVGRRTVVRAQRSVMPAWQDHLFIALHRNAADPTDVFRIPPGRVVEMGTQVSV